MSERQVVVVADGGPADGLGHLSRSGAVAAALTAKGVSTSSFSNGAAEGILRDGVEWTPLETLDGVAEGQTLLLDSYRIEPDEARSRSGARSLAAMHDPLCDTDGIDLAISPAAEPGRDGVLAGLEWCCLRPAYWGVRPRERQAEDVGRILITAGGATPPDVLAALEAACKAALPEAKLRVTGPSLAVDPLLPELLAADLCVCGAGQTMLEAVACGVPSVAVPVAGNQRIQLRRLADADAVVASEPKDVQQAVFSLASDRGRRQELALQGPQLVDGFGAFRVAYRLIELGQ